MTMCIYFNIALNNHCGFSVIYLGSSICQFAREVKYLGIITYFSLEIENNVVTQPHTYSDSQTTSDFLPRKLIYCIYQL